MQFSGIGSISFSPKIVNSVVNKEKTSNIIIKIHQKSAKFYQGLH